MTFKQVIDHFGGVAEVARTLDISYQAVREWGLKGAVPEGRQWQIQAITGGELKADANDKAVA